MYTNIHPKLPMRNKDITLAFYTQALGFKNISALDYPYYLILAKDQIELHFFLHQTLNPFENYGQVYIRTKAIDTLYQQALSKQLAFSDGGKLEHKPWGQREFSLLDPDHNLLTFGEEILSL